MELAADLLLTSWIAAGVVIAAGQKFAETRGRSPKRCPPVRSMASLLQTNWSQDDGRGLVILDG